MAANIFVFGLPSAKHFVDECNYRKFLVNFLVYLVLCPCLWGGGNDTGTFSTSSGDAACVEGKLDAAPPLRPDRWLSESELRGGCRECWRRYFVRSWSFVRTLDLALASGCFIAPVSPTVYWAEGQGYFQYLFDLGYSLKYLWRFYSSIAPVLPFDNTHKELKPRFIINIIHLITSCRSVVLPKIHKANKQCTKQVFNAQGSSNVKKTTWL